MKKTVVLTLLGLAPELISSPVADLIVGCISPKDISLQKNRV